MEIVEILEALLAGGLSRTEIGNVLDISQPAVTMIYQGKRNGEKYRAKLELLLEQQKTKQQSLVVYETRKRDESLEQALRKSEWELAHERSRARVEMFERAAAEWKDYERELKAACHTLGLTYQRGYKPQMNQQELDIIEKAVRRTRQLEEGKAQIRQICQSPMEYVETTVTIVEESEPAQLPHGARYQLPPPASQSTEYQPVPTSMKGYCRGCGNYATLYPKQLYGYGSAHICVCNACLQYVPQEHAIQKPVERLWWMDQEIPERIRRKWGR